MLGRIVSVRNHGTIISMVCKGKRPFTVYWGWRMFKNFYEASGGNVLGKVVRYNDEIVSLVS